MFPKIRATSISLLFIGIFLFAFALQNNFHMVPKLLMNKGLSAPEIEDMELLELLGYIIVGFVLIHLVIVVSNKKIMISGLVCYIGAMVCLITIQDLDLLKVYLMIMAGGSFCYVSLILIKIVEYAGQNKNYGLAMFLLLWAIGHLCADHVTNFFDPPTITKFVINASLCFLVIITTFCDEELIFNSSSIKFSILASNIEMQAVTGFIVSYITTSLCYYYDAFAVISSMGITDMDLAKDYMIIGILIFIMPLMWLLSNINKYLFNLLLLASLLISFILLPIYGPDKLSNILTLMVIGASLCSIFVCNLSILSDKFEGSELKAAILMYFTMTSIGSYCGAFAARVGGYITNKQFTVSICLVIGYFLIYYIWRFVRLRLY